MVDPLPPSPCKRCKATGRYLYPSTTTWRGGIGGCAMTEGICDKCWGSGDDTNPGENLRETKSK